MQSQVKQTNKQNQYCIGLITFYFFIVGDFSDSFDVK